MRPFQLFLLLISLYTLSGCVENIYGCTDPSSPDYNPDATIEDGSCGFSVPDSYTFERSDQSAVDLDATTVRQLLINDLQLKILALGQPGATGTTLEELSNYLSLDDASISILTPVGGDVSPLDSIYSGITSSANLSDVWVDLPGYFMVSEQVPAWLASIAGWSQTPRRGTPDAYTTTEGLDLSQVIPISLMGAVLYAEAMDSALVLIDTLDNIDFLSGEKFTEMEQAWDQAFGYFGAARAYQSFSDDELASSGSGSIFPYVKDADADGLLDYSSEFNHSFARLAGARDQGSDGATDFTQDIFDAWLLGRAAMAIGPGEEESIMEARDQILQTWEEIVGATFVHYLNKVLAHTNDFDEADFDLAAYRADWSAMYAYGQMLGYYSAGKTGGTLGAQNEILVLGEAPFMAPVGSNSWGDYVAALEGVRGTIGLRLSFAVGLLEKW
jgi:hypothetical protein